MGIDEEPKQCLICHRKLKSAESRARGLGKTCWNKLKKLDKDEKKRKKAKQEANKLKEEIIKNQINVFEEVDKSGGSFL